MSRSTGRAASNTVDPVEVPEVAKLLEIETELQQLIASNPTFYGQLCKLAEERNTCLQNADKVVRASGISCGPFVKLTETTDVNVQQLEEELGMEGFRAVGGYTEEVTTYKIDRERFLAYLAAGHIPKAVAAATTSMKRSYKKIDPYKLP